MAVTTEAVRELRRSQIARTRAVLAEAFHDDPLMRYAFPDATRRPRQLAWLFERNLRYGLRYGTVLAAGDVDAVAVWVGPSRHPMTISREIRVGMLATPFVLGLPATLRLRRFAACREVLHGQSVQGRHWYLCILGVSPKAQGGGLGRAVVQPVLDRADAERLPCYLETTNERNVGYFERYDFAMAGTGRVVSGPTVWAMVRRSRRGA